MRRTTLFIALLILPLAAFAQLDMEPPKGGFDTSEGMPDLSELHFKKTPTGLRYAVLESGDFMLTPGRGQTAVVHYTGWLYENGRKFDSSRDRGKPIEVRVGAGQVVPGWDEMLSRMERGSRVVVVLPPDLAYGKRGSRTGEVPIPGNATLVFQMELIAIK